MNENPEATPAETTEATETVTEESQTTTPPAEDAEKEKSVTKLKLVFYPDPKLMERCEDVKPSEITEFAGHIEAMTKIMELNEGIGLAAPQVGIQKRFFLMKMQETDEVRVIFNPEIIKEEEEMALHQEGCLSFPNLMAPVYRPTKLTAKGLDQNGEPFEEEFEGRDARAFSHETDHTLGILFIQRLGQANYEMLRGKLRDMETEYYSQHKPGRVKREKKRRPKLK